MAAARYPGGGLNPIRLASILRAADHGDPVRFFELAETIEERDPHYLGVLSTRKRSVSQIEVTIEAASDEARDIKMADMVRDWVERDDLTGEMFNILDCLGKGVSFTEIEWEVSERQWRPRCLIRRDSRSFRFARIDLETPLMLDDLGREVPLAPFKFIYANIPAKTGLPLRSGPARIAAWGWMFKAFTLRDWSIFTQTYGQPLRIGKWHTGATETGATEQDKARLFQAVANVAGDCAAIIPETMKLEFIESKSIGSSSDLYEKRADWLDRQISKAVLGQTATTDAIAGGHAIGREHRQVQEDIETADARALSAILNRDLVRPWIDLEFGPQIRYPRLRIARPDAVDIKQLSEVVASLVPLGLRVEESQMRDRLGFSDPQEGATLLAAVTPSSESVTGDSGQASPFKRFSGVFKRVEADKGVSPALQSVDPATGEISGASIAALLADRLTIESRPSIAELLARIEAMMGAASSLEELREMLLAGFPKMDDPALAKGFGNALLAAELAGRLAAAQEADDA